MLRLYWLSRTMSNDGGLKMRKANVTKGKIRYTTYLDQDIIEIIQKISLKRRVEESIVGREVLSQWALAQPID